jgi:hypothetical protein
MVSVEVVRIGWQDRDAPESPVIDVAAIKVWRWRWDAEIRVGGVTAGDASSRVADPCLFRHGCQRRLLARCRRRLSSS